MAARQLFCISVLLVLTQMFCRAATQQCTGGESEKSMLGWMLKGHIYKTMLADLPHTCVLWCRKDDRCQSLNWVISISMCEFSNRTKEARPEDFIPNPDRFYFRRDQNRVTLGSIPKLPAETCKEIKASEGQAVSGKYWIYTVKPGVPVLAHCNMENDDVDECSVSPSLCDFNANCTNTRGSYFCTCKPGFSGDGKTCIDIDECIASSPVCDVNANCKNTRGSYFCTCKSGFVGDGKNCTDVDECSVSSPLCDVNANCTNTRGSYFCTCKPGFFGDGKTCTDVDECTASSPVCDVNASCTNTRGSYFCTCKSGFVGDGKNCTASFRVVFTNLGASGRLGPISLGSHYNGQDHDGQVTLVSGIQQWIVPWTGDYRIEAIGAAGGYGTGSNNGQYRGRGAKMIGTFRLSQGEAIRILVGQKGSVNSNGPSSGGGGGTFVVRGSNTPLIIAGGGGGMEGATSRHPECDASTGTAGRAGYKSWAGGSGGHGAQTADSGNSGGGGGGFYSNGRSSTQFGGSMGNGGEGGRGFLQGGVGGRAWYNNAVGGFGGGAGAYGSGGGAGGGGGYSGGSSGDNESDSCGGGGGSYNAGTNQQNECCYNTAGHGQVTITLI